VDLLTFKDAFAKSDHCGARRCCSAIQLIRDADEPDTSVCDVVVIRCVSHVIKTESTILFAFHLVGSEELGRSACLHVRVAYFICRKRVILLFSVGKIAEKAVCKSVFFDNVALYFECQINKNALPRLFFVPILPTGL